jgi:serine/threonine protein kinase
MGRYTIVDELGSGGMGVVYRARDEKLGRVVALKMVSRAVLASDETRRHFRREAMALAKLNHPHIASVYDAGEQDGAHFLVMELVQGESLAKKLRAGPLPVGEATAIARQIAEALGEAHEQGVVHRDLKPANVVITPKGDVKVLDFGLAKLLAANGDAAVSVAETRGILGTPAYMSPEQALGKSVDARTDLWGLGVLYFESLAGRPPFIWVARSDGSQSRKLLTVDGDPNWIRFSPDGSRLRFGVRDEHGKDSLWEAHADGSGARQLLSGDEWPNECCGAWTADGKYFIFESMRGGDWNLWAIRGRREWWRKVDADPVRLTTGASVPQSPLPSLNGNSVYFMGITKRGELERFDQKKRTFTLFLPGVSADSLEFSRDGSKIAYVSLPEGNLWVCNADGSEGRELTFEPLKATLPRWSPDGGRIAFVGREAGKVDQVYAVPSAGGNPEQLTQVENGAWDPTRDGEVIFHLNAFQASCAPLRVVLARIVNQDLAHHMC